MDILKRSKLLQYEYVYISQWGPTGLDYKFSYEFDDRSIQPADWQYYNNTILLLYYYMTKFTVFHVNKYPIVG